MFSLLTANGIYGMSWWVVEWEDDGNVDAANVVSFVLCLELMVVCVGMLSPFPGNYLTEWSSLKEWQMIDYGYACMKWYWRLFARIWIGGKWLRWRPMAFMACLDELWSERTMATWMRRMLSRLFFVWSWWWSVLGCCLPSLVPWSPFLFWLFDGSTLLRLK